LWADEVYTVWRAALPLPELLGEPDTHPVLYYLLIHYWSALGSSEIIYRLPSALAGAAAVGLLYWAGSALAGPRVGLLAALLLALAPLHVWYSQEARMYLLASTLALASMGCLVHYLRRPAAWSLLGGLVFTGLGALTDYTVLL